MEICILGCRGSYPVAAPDIMKYGGDTTCVEIRVGSTLLVMDAWTGLRKLNTRDEGVTDVHLFITHLHWDHIIGFPQWSLLWNRPEVTLNIYGLERSHNNFYRALERSISEPFYNHNANDLMVKLMYHEVKPGMRIDIKGGIEVTCAYANHPYRALGYRVDYEGQSFSFVPDTAPFDRYLFGEDVVFIDQSMTAPDRAQLVTMQDALINLIGDSTWLYYDAALTPAEYEMLPHWGHSTMDQAAEMARAANIQALIFSHHAPRRTDDQVDAMLAEQQAKNPDMKLLAAYAGMLLGQEVNHAR